MAPLVAAVAGATVVAAAALAGRRRRRASPSASTDRAGQPSRTGQSPTEASPTGQSPTGQSRTGPPVDPAAAPGVSPPHPVDRRVAPASDRSTPVASAADAMPRPPLTTDPVPAAPSTDPAPAVTDTVLAAPSLAPPTASTAAGGTPVATGPAPARLVTTGADAPLPGNAPPPVLGGQAHSQPQPLPRRRARAVAGGVVALALVVGVGAVVASASGDSGPGTASTSAGGEGDPTPAAEEPQVTTTTPPPVTAATAFGTAASRLTAAGSFSYTGTVSATDVSAVRPMLWLAVQSTVEGRVALATARLHETAIADDGRAAETVTDGAAVWGRRADTGDDLAAEAFEPIPALSGDDGGEDGGDGDDAGAAEGGETAARGAVLLPTWLAAAVEPTDAGVDEVGRPRFTATIPADVLGQIERERDPVDATVVLTLNRAGVPVRVEITAAPGGPPLHLVYDIAGVGAPVDIRPPA